MFQRRSGSTPAGPAVAQMQVGELQKAMQAQQPLQLIDVRSAEEFQFDGRIAGARLIPLPMLATRISEIAQDTPVVLICRSGNRSQLAAEMLARAGFRDVRNLQGGMLAWSRAGYPSR